ncbi:regulator SirB [bacterium endosymbiont of Escarpia laminata]|nr:MAG: regulator SirB [bacterium endosymbiont of Escarpia laminata]
MTELYPWIKYLHVTTVVITGMMFVQRYLWMLSNTLQEKGGWIRVVPHVNDTLLLFSGLAMALMIQQYPLVTGWLTAKLVALLAYIIIGSIALKRGRNRQIRTWAGLLALTCYFYIIGTALSRSPIPQPELILHNLLH